MINHREVLRLHSLKLNKEDIAASINCACSSVTRTLKRAEEEGLTWDTARSMTEAEVSSFLYPDSRTGRGLKQHESPYLEPDYKWIQQEYNKPQITVHTLWAEYAEQARAVGKKAYSYSHFWRLYRDYRNGSSATTYQGHFPGGVMQAGWCETQVYYTDRVLDKPVPCFVFVAVLPCSGYTYAEAMPNTRQESWLLCHVHAFEFLGGVPKMITPFNFNAGVSHDDNCSVVPNRAYTKLAEYYSTAVVPVRPQKLQTTASVERTMRYLDNNVFPLLCNEQLFSLRELNTAIQNRVQEFNHQPLQKASGTRYTVFETMEKDTLRPLPEMPYEP